jgi:hypothetical protein
LIPSTMGTESPTVISTVTVFVSAFVMLTGITNKKTIKITRHLQRFFVSSLLFGNKQKTVTGNIIETVSFD